MRRRRPRAATTDEAAPEQPTTAPAATLPPDRRHDDEQHGADDRRGRDLWRDAWGRAANRSAQTLLVLALVVVVVWAGVQLRLLVVPLLLSILIAAAASPLVALLSRQVPRALAVWITLLTAFAVLGGLGYLVGSAVRAQWSELVTGASEGLDELQRFLTEGPLGLDQEQIDSARSQLGELASGAQVQAGAITGATLVVEVLAGLFLGLVLLFFLLKDGAGIWRFARSFLPDRHGDRYDVVADRAVEVLGGYVRGTAIIAFVDAVVIGVALLVLGVPLALPLAVIVFVGAFVPLVGATVAGALAALIALVGNGPLTALIVVGVVIAVNQLEGDLLAPVVLGRSLNLHPLAVLLALTAGTIVAGIVGAILAVPFAAVAWAVVDTWRSPDEAGDDGRTRRLRKGRGATARE